MLGYICTDTVANNQVDIFFSIFEVNLRLTLDSGRMKMSENTVGIIFLQFLWNSTLLDIIIRFYLT
jgi:hypothetical protein